MIPQPHLSAPLLTKFAVPGVSLLHGECRTSRQMTNIFRCKRKHSLGPAARETCEPYIRLCNESESEQLKGEDFTLFGACLRESIHA